MSGITVRSIVAKLGWDVDEGKLGRWTRKTDEAKKGLEGVDRQAAKTKKSVVSMATEGLAKFDLLTNGIAKLVAPLREVISTGARFESLRASLTTVEGSADKAASTFERLQKFAASTPFQLDELTESYLLLNSQGLEGGERAMRSYGDTAASMGKSFKQMAEAVADAATGEFERLKEFGIKASKSGDEVTFAFRGMKTTVANNAEEIQRYLVQLGETSFAGGMERQSKTLAGLWSTLKDNIAASSDEIVQAGLGDILKEWIGDATEAAKAVAEWVKRNKELIRTKLREYVSKATNAARELWPMIKKLAELAISLAEALTQVTGGIGPAVAGLTALRIAVVAATGPWGALAAAAVAAGAAIVVAMADAEKRTESLGRAAARIGKKGRTQAGIEGKSAAELRQMQWDLRKERAEADRRKRSPYVEGPDGKLRKIGFDEALNFKQEREADLRSIDERLGLVDEALKKAEDEDKRKREDEERARAAEEDAFDADVRRSHNKAVLKDLRARHKKGQLSDDEIDQMRDLEKEVGKYVPKAKKGKKPKKKKSLMDLVTGRGSGGAGSGSHGLGTTIINIDARSTIKVEVSAPDGMSDESPNARRAAASELGWNTAQALEPYWQDQARRIAKAFEG